MRLALDTRLRREGTLVAVAGLFSGLPLAIELLRAHWGLTTLARPDRIVGWTDDLYALPLGLLWLLALSLVARAALALRRSAPPPRTVALALALVAAAVASLVMELAAPDAFMYESNVVRGYAAVAVSIAWPASIALGGLTLWSLGRRVAAVLSFFAAGISVWAAASVVEIAALNGGHQPPVDSALLMQGIGAAWLVGAGCLIAAGFGLRPDPLAGRGLPAGIVTVGLSAVLAVALVSGLVPRARAIAPVLAAQLSGRTAVATIQVAGVERTYRLHVPPAPLAHPPLVVVLHPVFGSGFQAEEQFHLDVEADTRGWLVAYPDGVLDGWDAFGSNSYWGLHVGADDIAFLSDMVDRIAADHSTDPTRLYVTGFSRGGLMVYRAGCELRQPVAAIVPVSGNMATESGSADVACHPRRPVSLLAIHGTADPTIPIDGGHVDINYSPLADVIARWRTIDGCGPNANTVVDGRNTTTTWRCAGGSAVSTRIVAGGGHGIPPDGASVIAAFFDAHPLAGAGS